MNPLEDLAKKYTPMSEYVKDGKDYSRNINLNEPFETEEDTVIAFYTYENHIYCITDDEWDIDPLEHFDEETMKRFIDYISDENNINVKN